MVLTWATRLADRVAGAVAMATSPRLTSQALAFDVVGRNAILRDPAYHKGRYYDARRRADCRAGHRADAGTHHLPVARGDDAEVRRPAASPAPCAHPVRDEVRRRLVSGLSGRPFGERFDANSYLTLTMAIDLFDLGDTREKLARRLGQSSCRWLLMSFSSDWLFPPFQSQETRRCA